MMQAPEKNRDMLIIEHLDIEASREITERGQYMELTRRIALATAIMTTAGCKTEQEIPDALSPLFKLLSKPDLIKIKFVPEEQIGGMIGNARIDYRVVYSTMTDHYKGVQIRPEDFSQMCQLLIRCLDIPQIMGCENLFGNIKTTIYPYDSSQRMIFENLAPNPQAIN